MNLRTYSGYTLLEVIVVLILLTIAAGLVIPSLHTPRLDDPASMAAVIKRAREAAVRRGELVQLHIGRSGSWQATAGGNSEILMTGLLRGNSEGTIDLLFSPLGSCGAAPEAIQPNAVSVDPLTCEVQSP
jgi:prepilin-type N-terminal cleavage/methylation domain-containing protein